MTSDPAGELHVSIALDEDATLHLRPIHPDDAASLAEGFEHLSPESRYMRFFSPLERLSATQLDYFTHIDYDRHFALVAYFEDPDGGDDIGVGVARYIRLDDPSKAEAAVVVLDEFHRRGIGRVLLEALLTVAHRSGVATMLLVVHADNTAMTAMMAALGATPSPGDDATTVDFTIDLGEFVAARADSALRQEMDRALADPSAQADGRDGATRPSA
ncbi:MAG: GNAT family N-acetyltransferase [Microthrixaceae bacterium]